MKLLWDATQAAAVARHAERGYPHEVCGILVGRRDPGRGLSDVVEVVPVDNAWADEGERVRRFQIEPVDILRVERRAREEGLEIVGFYHSHPDHPARPSTTDREFAWPVYAYVIQSVTGGRAGEAACWRLRDDRSEYEREVIEFSVEQGVGHE